MNVAFPTVPSARVSQVFGNSPKTSSGQFVYAGDHKHKGIDYAIVVGTPVYSAMDGKVEVADVRQTGYGRSVRIRNIDGSYAIYGHLSKHLVTVGEVVAAGQQIGFSGGDPNDKIDGDGMSTGAHLHFEIRPPGKTASDQTAVESIEYLMAYLPLEGKPYETTTTLNVRTNPGGPVLYTLQKRARVYVVEADASVSWLRLRALRPEWCSASYLSPLFEQPASEEPSDAEKLAILWKDYLVRSGK
jgi:murein DD-endopeptidase MepM/ murein hydrolase activator NlpD